jgi:hypothetical protein
MHFKHEQLQPRFVCKTNVSRFRIFQFDIGLDEVQQHNSLGTRSAPCRAGLSCRGLSSIDCCALLNRKATLIVSLQLGLRGMHCDCGTLSCLCDQRMGSHGRVRVNRTTFARMIWSTTVWLKRDKQETNTCSCCSSLLGTSYTHSRIQTTPSERESVRRITLKSWLNVVVDNPQVLRGVQPDLLRATETMLENRFRKHHFGTGFVGQV